MAFTHARNILYRDAGHEVCVLNFAADKHYTWDGINVLPEQTFDRLKASEYDVFVFHSPNIRNHLRFMLKLGSAIRCSVLVSHGFEFINWFQQNNRSFDFQRNWKSSLLLKIGQVYDFLKLKVWAGYFRKLRKSGPAMVFVSDWLKECAEGCLGLNLNEVLSRVEVISNPVHPIFIQRRFDPLAPKVADFVSIRNFDDPKYGVDIVVEIARRNPQFTFHLYGEGDYFDFNSAPKNLTVVRRKFKQRELPDLFNQYRAALLPTRWDSQGVLMCEVATFGIPTVVSDIPICKSMVGEFPNVEFFDNENPKQLSFQIKPVVPEDLLRKFGTESTVERELRLFTSLKGTVSQSDRSPGLSSVLFLANAFYQFLNRRRKRRIQTDFSADGVLSRGPAGVRTGFKADEARLENPAP
jgi:glycosyltransferase involved in cell wall biosynthesis